MKFKALATMILYHEGRMVIINKDDKDDLPDDVVQPYIDAKQAVAIKGRAAKAEPDPDTDADEGETDAAAPPV